jgi:hypothetical protein
MSDANGSSEQPPPSLPTTPSSPGLSWEWVAKWLPLILTAGAIVGGTAILIGGKADAAKVEEHSKMLATLNANIEEGRKADERVGAELGRLQASFDEVRLLTSGSLRQELERRIAEHVEAGLKDRRKGRGAKSKVDLVSQ